MRALVSDQGLPNVNYTNKKNVFLQIGIPLFGLIVDLFVALKIVDVSALLVLAAIYILFSFLVPSREFFNLILSAAIFCPIHYFGFTGFLGYVPVTMAIVLIASTRSLKYFGFQELKVFYFASAFVFALSVLAGLLNNSSLVLLLVSSAMVSFVWLLSPKLLSRPKPIAENKLSIMIVSAGLGLLSVFEYVGQTNILGWYFASSDLALVQKWAGFRVLTVLGHPLVNGMVFAILGVSILILLLDRFSIPTFTAFLLIITALALTTSKSGIVAFFGGAATILIIRVARGQLRIVTLIALSLAALIGASFTNSNDLFGRFTSSESTGSNDYRFYLLTQASKIIGSGGLIGGGPLTSASTWNKLDASGLPLENSILQILASHGLGLTLVGFAGLLFSIRARFREGKLAAGPIVVTYLACAAGFNLYEAYPSMLLILVLVMSFVYKPPEQLE